MFLKNAWYVAAVCDDVSDEQPLAMKVAGEPIVLYRSEAGEPVALEDRCCHRFAPLSLGRIEGSALRCMYHGLLFDQCGRVVEVPGQDKVPAKARARSYPVCDFGGWVWIWMGDPERADKSLLPPVYGLDNPEWYMGHGRLDYQASYQLINNNLTDLGHLSWVHTSSFGADHAWSETLPSVEVLERGVRINRWLRNIPPIPPLGKASQHERVDHWAQLDYYVPGIFHFYNAEYPDGTAARYAGEAPAPTDPGLLYETYTQQAVTPMDERTTRYFYSWGPSVHTGQPADRDLMLQMGEAAFGEDREMIEAQQKIIDGDPQRQPVMIVHDRAVVAFDRLMERLMKEERTMGEATE